MSFFLFAKQFVDLLYQFQILDYIMVIMVFLLLIYQIALVRPDIRKRFSFTDGIVLALSLLLTISLLRSSGGYQTYFKVLSAFLIYFVGRVYYDRIQECFDMLVLASYIVVYLNFARRISKFGLHFLKVKNAGGDFYYYDTDMAFAMILAMIFIAMYGKSSLLKLLTIFLICPYMVFCSDAGIQSVLMIAVYGIIIIYIGELVLRKRKITGFVLLCMITLLIFIVVCIYMPLWSIDVPDKIFNLSLKGFFDYKNMCSRYADWKNILAYCSRQTIAAHLFGIDLGAEVIVQSLYLKIYYSLGIVGLVLSLALLMSILYYVVKVEDRKTFYLTVMMMILLLGSGVTVNSLETTQMSWFPFLFSGMVISSVQVQREQDKEGMANDCNYNRNY